MNKFLTFVRSLFARRKDRFDHLHDAFERMVQEAELEVAMNDALAHSEWEHNILTAGRPVTLLPGSRTLH